MKRLKRRLPDEGGKDGRLVLLRRMLLQPPADRDIEEFQTLVGHFVLGMTLEIGITMQDEFDQALQVNEKTLKLLDHLEKLPRLNEEDLGRALFQVDLTERELKRIRASDRKWKNHAPDAAPFKEFNTLKKNITGRPPTRSNGWSLNWQKNTALDSPSWMSSSKTIAAGPLLFAILPAE